VRLSILHQTSTNSARQNVQALNKQWCEEIGAETELRNISPSVFFSADPSSQDTYGKFYVDIEMYTNSFLAPTLNPTWATTFPVTATRNTMN
jgi:peptide/nickel transport system substrate-binding protein